DRSLRIQVAQGGRAVTLCKMGRFVEPVAVSLDFLIQGRGASDRIAIELPSGSRTLVEASATLGRGMALRAGSATYSVDRGIEPEVWYRSTLTFDSSTWAVSWMIDDRASRAPILRTPPIPLGTDLGIAIFTRFWMLGGTGFSGDEAVYSGQAAVIAGKSEMARYFVLISRGNSNFLMFQYLVAGAYHLFGISDAVPRIVSAVFSTLTVPIAYELGRTLFNRRVAIGSAILLAVSSYTIALGRLALLDAALGFFFALSMLFAAKWIRSHQKLWLYAFAGAAALTIQVKVTGVLVL